MNNNIKFNIIIEKLNKKIAHLNIQLSKDTNNSKLHQELQELLTDKEKVYKGTLEDLENIILKYGESNNE